MAYGMEVGISKIQMEHTTPEMAIWSFLHAPRVDTPISLRSSSVMVRKVVKSVGPEEGNGREGRMWRGGEG